MDIKERFYDNLNMLREGVEKGNQKLVGLENSRAAAKKAIGHVNKHNYEAAHAAVKGTALEKGLHSHLNRAQKHWEKMNIANNEAGKHSTSSKNYDSLRSKANDHQDQAEHHHDNAVEFLKGYMRMDEEVEQLDAKKKSDKKDKLFLRSRKMIAVSKLDRNRNRNKDNRSTPDLSSKIKKNLKTSNLDRNRKRNKNNRQD